MSRTKARAIVSGVSISCLVSSFRSLKAHRLDSEKKGGGFYTRKFRRAVHAFDFPGGLFQNQQKLQQIVVKRI